MPQYYVRDSHPAIIAPELFDRVQIEMQRRQAVGNKYSGKSIFSGRIVCGDCGGYYGSKVWNSTDKYRKVIWQCNKKYEGTKCRTHHLEETAIQKNFLAAYNQLIANKDALLDDLNRMLAFLSDMTQLDTDLAKLQNEQEIVFELTRKLVSENAAIAQRQTDYLEKYTSLVDRYEDIATQIAVLQQKRSERLDRNREIEIYIDTIVNQKGELQEFDPRVWMDVMDIVTVHHDGRMVFRFKDGREAEI